MEIKNCTVTLKVIVTLKVNVTLKVTLSKVPRRARTTIFKLVGPCKILSRSKIILTLQSHVRLSRPYYCKLATTWTLDYCTLKSRNNFIKFPF